MAEAALSVEMYADNDIDTRALHELLSLLARDACMWATNTTWGSGEGNLATGKDTDCMNTTDILRFARQKVAEIYFPDILSMNTSLETFAIAQRLQSIIITMKISLRDWSNINGVSIMPRQESWVTENVSPINRCYVCTHTFRNK